MIWDEFLRHFRFCDEEDSGLSDEEQERKGPKNLPKHTRKQIHQAKKNFLEKFKTASKIRHFIQFPSLFCLKIEKRFGLLEAFFADRQVVELLVSRVHYDAKRIVPCLQVGKTGNVARQSAAFIAVFFPAFRHVRTVAKCQAQRVRALAGRVVYQVYGNRRIFVMRRKVVGNCSKRVEVEVTVSRSVRI